MAKRDWKLINESLVKRGEILLDMRILDKWESELAKLNEGKEGGQYVYPETFIRLLGYMHLLFHLPYRQTEGFLKALRKFESRIRVPDYSTIDRRVNKLNIRLGERYGDDVVIAIDASGIKVANRGDWIRHKWKVRRGYLKIHIAVDIKSKRIVSMDVTNEKISDGNRLKKLVSEASRKVKVSKVLADGAYDSKRNFSYLANKRIEPVIKVRKNASSKARGCMARKLAALEYLKDSDCWKQRHRYGQRWIVESVFSSLKRTFGEYVSAKSMRNMVVEMMLKASLYNMLIGINATTQG